MARKRLTAVYDDDGGRLVGTAQLEAIALPEQGVYTPTSDTFDSIKDLVNIGYVSGLSYLPGGPPTEREFCLIDYPKFLDFFFRRNEHLDLTVKQESVLRPFLFVNGPEAVDLYRQGRYVEIVLDQLYWDEEQARTVEQLSHIVHQTAATTASRLTSAINTLSRASGFALSRKNIHAAVREALLAEIDRRRDG